MHIISHLPHEAIIAVFSLVSFLIGLALGALVSRNESGGRSGGGDRERGNQRGGRQQGRKGGGRGGNEIIELYIGNLAYEVSEKELNKAFAEYGEVVSARCIKNRFNGKSKGFGFVEMDGREDAEAAIRAMNGKDWKGRRIVVNEARSHSRE